MENVAGRPEFPSPAATPLDKKKVFGAGLAIVLTLLIWFVTPLFGMPANTAHMLALLCGALVLWICQAIPAEMTALLIMVLPALLNIVPLKTAFSGWVNSTTWFLFGAHIIGRLISVSGFDKRLTWTLLRIIGGNKLSVMKIVIAIVVLCMITVMVVPSSTVLSLLLAAQIFPLVSLFGLNEKSNVAKLFMLSIPVFVLLCGRHSLPGSVHNMVLYGCLTDYGYDISMLGWFLAILPLTVIVGALILFIYKMKIKPEVKVLEGGREVIQNRLDELGPMGRKEKETAILFILALVLWLTGFATNIPAAYVSLGIAAFAMLPRIGVLSFKESISKINWGIIIFVASVLSLPSIMTDAGMNELFASFFNFLSTYFGGEIGLLVLLWILSQVVTWLGLSVSAPLLFMPFLFPISESLGIPVVYLVLLQCVWQPAIMYYHAPAPLVVASYGAYSQGDYAKYQWLVIIGFTIFAPLLYLTWWPFLTSIGLL
jgi:anion transporter